MLTIIKKIVLGILLFLIIGTIIMPSAQAELSEGNWWDNVVEWFREKLGLAENTMEITEYEAVSILDFEKIHLLKNKIEENSGIRINDDFKKIKGTKTIKHTTIIENKEDKDKAYNYSLRIQIPTNEIRWNETKYILGKEPIKLTSFKSLEGEIVTPNIFFGKQNSRINFKDVTELGGYALAYEYAIELKIDNIKIKPYEMFIIDPTYTNQTDGFSTGVIGSNFPMDITTNGSDFWITDESDDWVYHTDRDGNNITDGFSTADIGSNNPKGITTNGSDFWIVENMNNLVFHTDREGNDIGDGFNIGDIGSASPHGITTNGSDFWITDYGDDWVYYIDGDGNNLTGFSTADIGSDYPSGITTNGSDFWIADHSDDWIYHTDRDGNNITDGFSTAAIGSASPQGITIFSSGNLEYKSGIPDGFYIIDSTDDWAYHIGTHFLITNIYPENNSEFYSKHINFTYNVSVSEGITIENCSLYLNGILNQTDNTITEDVDQTFNLTVDYGQYLWKVGCWDDENYQDNSTEWNYTRAIPSPIINLQAPADGINTTSKYINFTYNVSDPYISIDNCKLWLNNSATGNFQLNYTDDSIYNPPTEGQEGEWLFEGNADDSSGNGNDGTVTGATLTTGQYGQGYEFDGIDDYIETSLTDNSAFTNGFTISAWINPNSMGEVNGRILDKSTGLSGDNGFLFAMGGMDYENRIILKLNVGTTALSNNNVVYEDWTHILVTVSSGQLANFYVNGVLSGTANQDLVQPLSAITTTNAMRIGNRPGATDRTFDGTIDEVAIYNRVLTTDEITELYEYGLHAINQTMNITLGNEHNHDWKIECENTNELKANSSTYSFLYNTPPTIPNLITPANNTIIMSTSINLSCNGSTDADGDTINYEFYGDTNNPPTTLLQNSSLITYNWSGLTENFYYWRCRANDNITHSDWIDIRILNNLGGGSFNITNNTSCPTGFISTACYDIKDEENLTSYSGNIKYNFELALTDSNFSFYGELENTTQLCICINTTTLNNYTVNYGELQYSKEGFSDRRYYLFENTRLTGTQVNDTLFLLENSKATSFLFEFESTSLEPYMNKYTFLLRWYPNLDIYDIVDMGKTDEKGETIMRVVTEDVDYRVGLYYLNGSLIKLLSPVRFACLSSPCSYYSLIEEGEMDYNEFLNIETNLSWNPTTKIFTLIYNDPSQNTNLMNLTVYKDTGMSSLIVCEDSSTGYIGVLTCDVSAYTGTLRAVAFRSASPELPIAQKIVSIISSVFKSSTGLFFSIIVFIVFVFAGAFFGIIPAIVFGVASLSIAVVFGALSISVVIGLGMLGGIVIHFMKRV